MRHERAFPQCLVMPKYYIAFKHVTNRDKSPQAEARADAALG